MMAGVTTHEVPCRGGPMDGQRIVVDSPYFDALVPHPRSTWDGSGMEESEHVEMRRARYTVRGIAVGASTYEVAVADDFPVEDMAPVEVMRRLRRSMC